MAGRPPTRSKRIETPPRQAPQSSLKTKESETAPSPEGSRLSLYLLWGGIGMVVLMAFLMNRGAKPIASQVSTAMGVAAADARAVERMTSGTLAVREVWHETPEDHVRAQDCDELLDAWGAPTLGQFEEALTRGGLDEPTRRRVLSLARCDANGCAMTPPDEVVAALTPSQREGLHHAMREFPQAVMMRAPFSRPASRPSFTTDPRLPPAAREVIAAAEWVSGRTRYFAELPWLCHRVTDPAQRLAFFRVLRARAGLEVSVRVQAGDDLDAIARWWGRGAGFSEARARLDRALRDGSGEVPLRELLPVAMRQRFGTFPPRGTRYDCFWTALNFFSPTAEGGPFVQRGDFDEAVAGWREVPLDALRFGDALAFRTADGVTRHAAVYLAEDLVLTKDGWSMHRPWEISRLDTVRGIYHDATTLYAYRRP